MDTVKLTHDKLSVDEATTVVTSPKCGAISLFVGTTRDNFEEKKVVQLDYEAYDSMAEKVMRELCSEVRSKWAVENIAIFHRLGTVPVCEASVIIAISSEHRGESLAAVQHTINALKALVPIWKKEVYDDASSNQPEWKANKELIKKEPISEDNFEEVPAVTSDMIQIKAKPEEVRRRIEAFISRKRDDVNRINIRDFCSSAWKNDGDKSGSADMDDSCARVNAVLVPRKDGKSHLKIRRVVNEWGPQTRSFDPGPSTSAEENKSRDLPQGVAERLQNIERHLQLEENSEKPVARDVYARLKVIEDRILFLEGISPEYFSNLPQAQSQNLTDYQPEKKRKYSSKELRERLQAMQRSFQS
ncbi:molybdopterin synthase catalytic subunit isoform X1 [Neocloeon triangulifer]|uniref:molybdopterin synthase catalytic subunit isoform X1 n=1 Tax=Neocloeon triangulifer TaxID=2078957 RepID=UPI00286F88A4|nr:molybdopterin synthase catalytic subunit isoform X1 [Neocloeon triangulifer]